MTFGNEETWIDDHANDQINSTMANSQEMQEIANAGVQQDADYLVQTNGSAITSNEEQDNSLDESGLMDDQEWVLASKIAYKFFTGNKDGTKRSSDGYALDAENKMMQNKLGFDNGELPNNSIDNVVRQIPNLNTKGEVPLSSGTPMTDRDFAEWGLEFMGQFNWNLPMMGIRSGELAIRDTSASATPYGDPKLATYILMDKYDKLPNWTWNGTKRAFKGLISDPTTYAGLGTLGLAFLGKGTAKAASKGALKKFMKASISPTALVAYESGAYSGADNALRQSIKLMSNSQSKFDYGSLGQDVVVGMTFGGAIAGGASNLYRILPQERSIGKIYKTAQEAQTNLVSYLRGAIDNKKVISETTKDNVVDSGIKTRDTARDKVNRKGYTTEEIPTKLTDVVRTAVVVDNPADADEVVKALGEEYKVLEDGWVAYPGGYFDRKLVVETPEGNIAEIQFWSKGIARVKKELHETYEQARSIEPMIKNGSATPDQIVKYNELLIESDKIAADALISDMAGWSDIYSQIGMDIQPYLNLTQAGG